jgi:hypothetical protein
MGRQKKRIPISFIGFAAVLLLLAESQVTGSPVDSDGALRAVRGWLKVYAMPFRERLGEVRDVTTFRDNGRNPQYYVVNLQPAGFVVAAADELLEPIIAFSSHGSFDPSTNNPLVTLLSRDMPLRLTQARQLKMLAPGSLHEKARKKWQKLRQAAAALADDSSTVSGVDAGILDIRVLPLVQSRWNQLNVGTNACYNYYTPPYGAGDSRNYYCGCVPTAIAQIMRYHQWPTNGVGTDSFTITVDGNSEIRSLRGGDGFGGPYDWTNMPVNPAKAGATDTQRQAIGTLLADVGVSSDAEYTASGTGVRFSHEPPLRGVFHFANAIQCLYAWSGRSQVPMDALLSMVNPNLDAGYPVYLGIAKSGASSGHAVVCDGYGYNLATLYHHINLGWGGSYDAWYALPDMSTAGFDMVDNCIFNIFPTGTGEIISGRVTDATGVPVSGATVIATCSDGSAYTNFTSNFGIYAFASVPSAYSYSVFATLDGHFSSTNSCSTGTSVDSFYSVACGNVWAADLPLDVVTKPSFVVAPTNATTFPGGSATLRSLAQGTLPLLHQWFQSGCPIAGATNATLILTNVAVNFSGISLLVSNQAGTVQSAPVIVNLVPIAAWGANQYGQCEAPVEATNAIAVAGGRWHTVALKSDGTVTAWGLNDSGQCDVPPRMANASAVAAGAYFSLALLANGTVSAWGSGDYGESDVPPGLSDVKAISAGQYHCLALCSNGLVAAWGGTSSDVAMVPPDLAGVQAISAGYSHSLALLTNGTIRAWGANAVGQCDIPSGLANVTAVLAGCDSSLALKSDGTLVAWGNNAYGQTDVPAGLSNVVALAGYAHCLALKSDGSVVAWGATGGMNYRQTSVPSGLNQALSVAGIGRHSLALVRLPKFVPLLTKVGTDAGGFHASMQTEGGKSYVLEYTSALTIGTNWTALQTLLGDGRVQQLTDSAPTDRQRFYRVRVH